METSTRDSLMIVCLPINCMSSIFFSLTCSEFDESRKTPLDDEKDDEVEGELILLLPPDHDCI